MLNHCVGFGQSRSLDASAILIFYSTSFWRSKSCTKPCHFQPRPNNHHASSHSPTHATAAVHSTSENGNSTRRLSTELPQCRRQVVLPDVSACSRHPAVSPYLQQSNHQARCNLRWLVSRWTVIFEILAPVQRFCGNRQHHSDVAVPHACPGHFNRELTTPPWLCCEGG